MLQKSEIKISKVKRCGRYMEQ